VLASALVEAMALACGVDARAVSFGVSLKSSAPVGAYLEVEAWVESRDGHLANARATVTADRRVVAQARGSFRS